MGVESSGRLVEQDELRPTDQRAGHTHELLLSEGQLAGELIGGTGEADEFERRRDDVGGRPGTVDDVGEHGPQTDGLHCHREVLGDGQVGEQFACLPRTGHARPAAAM